MNMRAAGLAVLLLVAACSPLPEPGDGGAGGGTNASGGGSGGGTGGGGGSGGGTAIMDAGVDGGTADGGASDAGATDAGSTDAGSTDAGKPDGGGPADAGALPCFDDLDCPDPQLFYCNVITALCAPACANKAACTAAVRGQYALPHCDNNPLGCQCDEGLCVGAFCTADSECGAQVCRNGVCVAPPAATAIARCEVSPAFAVMAAGASLKFSVVAIDAAGNPIVPGTGAAWTAMAPLTTGAAPSFTQDFAATNVAGATGPVDAVQAAFGTVTCRAQVVVHPMPSTTVDVIAIDELTGRPLQGATVLFTVPATGAVIGTPVTTDARGLAQATVAAVSVTVSVFHPEYDYLTIAGYDVAAGSRSIVAPVRRNPLDRLGGFKGTFTSVPATSNLHIGSAGFSQASYFEPRQLAPPIPTHVKVGAAIDQMNVPLAAASTMGFAAQAIKPGYVVPVLNGACHTAAGALDTATTDLGACGSGTAFGLTADLPLGDVPLDALSSGLSSIDWPKLVAHAIPVYKKFQSTLRRDVEPPRAATATAADGGWVLDTSTNHAVVDLPFGQLPLAQSFVVRSPDLPSFRGRFADLVFVRGIAQSRARGLVEIGLASGVNTTPNDLKTDVQGTLATGLIAMRMAPTHHGLEGSPYAIMATAGTANLDDGATEGSSVIARLSSLAWDPTGITPVTLPAYLGFPDGARYNFTDAAQGALGPRTLRFASSISAATVVRATFTERLGRRWVVLFSPAAATIGFTLPKPTGVLPDRTFWEGVGTGSRALLRIDLTSYNDGSPIGFQSWMELGSGNPYRANDFSVAGAFVDLRRPSIAWTQPMNNGAVVAKGSAVQLVVQGFRVGTTAAHDGYVRLSFTNGTNCPPSDGVVDTTGKGDVSVIVPAACTGTSVQMTASLVDTAGVPLAPAVVGPTLTVSVQ